MVPKICKFLSFEGVDGAGKSSHIAWLTEMLTARGEEVVQTREPGGTPLGEKLRGLLLDGAMDIDTELMLMYAARREHLARVIEAALAQGKIVISDRFEDSTYAFQGGGRGIPFERIDEISQCCRGPRPDVTLFFDLPVEVAAKRMAGTRALDRFEKHGESAPNSLRLGSACGRVPWYQALGERAAWVRISVNARGFLVQVNAGEETLDLVNPMRYRPHRCSLKVVRTSLIHSAAAKVNRWSQTRSRRRSRERSQSRSA